MFESIFVIGQASGWLSLETNNACVHVQADYDVNI